MTCIILLSFYILFIIIIDRCHETSGNPPFILQYWSNLLLILQLIRDIDKLFYNYQKYLCATVALSVLNNLVNLL